MHRLLIAIALVVATPTLAAAQAPPPGPVYQPPHLRSGLTFEANIGFGAVHVSVDNGDSDSEGALGGLDIGLGAFITPNVAITGRIAGATYFEDDNTLTVGFFGPSLQYWASDTLWFGGGVGLGFAALSIGPDDVIREEDIGLDLRVGYTFPTLTQNSFNISFELNPVFFDGGTLTAVGLLFGYQRL